MHQNLKIALNHLLLPLLLRTATKAAHRTPPGSSALRESEASAAKRPAGTEINLTLC
ncbi:hypothetical protein [Lysinibacillus sp. NPDC056232]|uniref:hypothetical protein n=1 Tax=Lysinibacillus sp. NPDC056232 TaxID=3345756 RepID=UPI0035DF6336